MEGAGHQEPAGPQGHHPALHEAAAAAGPAARQAVSAGGAGVPAGARAPPTHIRAPLPAVAALPSGCRGHGAGGSRPEEPRALDAESQGGTGATGTLWPSQAAPGSLGTGPACGCCSLPLCSPAPGPTWGPWATPRRPLLCRPLQALGTIYELLYVHEYKAAVRWAFAGILLGLLTQLHYLFELGMVDSLADHQKDSLEAEPLGPCR